MIEINEIIDEDHLSGQLKKKLVEKFDNLSTDQSHFI